MAKYNYNVATRSKVVDELKEIIKHLEKAHGSARPEVSQRELRQAMQRVYGLTAQIESRI